MTPERAAAPRDSFAKRARPVDAAEAAPLDRRRPKRDNAAPMPTKRMRAFERRGPAIAALCGLLVWCFLMAALLLAAAMPAAAADERRVALVLGNAAYRFTAKLPNPRNDAEDLAKVLRRLGFEVFDGYDLDRVSMRDTLLRFARAAQTADTALAYYAGHGLQYRGENYLVPVDAKLQDEIDLDFQTVQVEDVLRALERARGTRILILDACRNLPLVGGRSSFDVFATRGLAKIGRRGMVIAYSTQADEVAFDGTGRNSVFTGALVREIEQPNLEIGQLFRRVAASVNRESGGKQTPELSLSLTQDFYFSRGETDRDVWGRIRASLDPAELRGFVERFPKSDLTEAARARLELLEILAQANDRRKADDETARQKADQERAAALRAEQERAASQKAERERAAAQKTEQDRIAAQTIEQERVAALRAEQERVAAQRAEDQRRLAEAAARDKAEQDRLAKVKAEEFARAKAEEERRFAEAAARAKAERERLAAQLAAEQAARTRAAEEKRLAEAAAQQKAEQDRLAAQAKASEEQRLAGAAAREKAEQDRLARLAAEEAARAKAAEEKRVAEAAARERAERDRLAAQAKAAEEKRVAEAAAQAKAAEEAARAKVAEEKRLAEIAARQKAEQDRLAAQAKMAEEKRLAEAAVREKAEQERQARAAAEEAVRTKAAEEKRVAEAEAREKAERERLAREETAARTAAEAQRLARLNLPGESVVRTLPQDPLVPAPAARPPAAPNPAALVRAAQGELKRIGCYAGQPDGVLDRGTRDALVSFRRHLGLAPAEDVGEDVVKLLQGRSAGACRLDCGRGSAARTCTAQWRDAREPAQARVPSAKPASASLRERCADILLRAQLGDLSPDDRELLVDACR